MKKRTGAWFGLCLIAVSLALLLAGCGAKEATDAFVSENEILTYAVIDPKKTQLLVSTLGNNANVLNLSAAFEARNPDVQVVCIDITGGNTDYKPVVDWAAHGVAPDLMFVNSDSFIDDKQSEELFMDLSAHPATQDFEVAALDRNVIDGRVYFLPAPSEINCIIYNKTLFERYGWEVPATFDDFVKLCARIREETQGAIQPWNPNAKYDSVFSTAIEAFTYEELFGGVENRGWYNDFCAEKGTFAGHMEPFYACIQTLIDNGILLEEHFSYSATSRGKEFNAGQIAMINAPVSLIEGSEYTFDFMPYPTTGRAPGYVNDYFSSLLCVPKKEHTDAVQDAIDRYIAFFGSAEGQQAIIGDSLMVGNIQDLPIQRVDALAGIQDVIAKGHKFNRLDFSGAGERNFSFQENALAMVKGEKTGAELIAEIDRKPYKSAAETRTEPSPQLAAVTEDFTILEFSNYIADMYREQAGADIGLINHGVAYRGNLVRLFKGDLYESYVTVLKPRSFANDSTLVKLSMTGAQLLEALNHPAGNDCVSNSVYAFSGLQCEIAPRNELGKKYLSVKLADGTAVDPQKRYTVAAWAGAIDEKYITETLETFEGTWETRMTEKLRADKNIAPAKDGRVKLVWR